MGIKYHYYSATLCILLLLPYLSASCASHTRAILAHVVYCTKNISFITLLYVHTYMYLIVRFDLHIMHISVCDYLCDISPNVCLFVCLFVYSDLVPMNQSRLTVMMLEPPVREGSCSD